MRIALSYKNLVKNGNLEEQFAKHISKLTRLLSSYQPDLVQLHATLEKNAHKEEYYISLNLTLPAGQLHATGEGGDTQVSVRRAFEELQRQVSKHVAKLRHDYQWKRKRARGTLAGITAVEEL
jgi:ribosome-associated translation inhibitor RaiA